MPFYLRSTWWTTLLRCLCGFQSSVRDLALENLAFDDLPRFLLFDNDTVFGSVKAFIESLGITPKQTSFRSPWQNGTCERVIGTLRRECFDHVIVVHEAHARRLLREYLAHYHDDRTHLGLDKDSPRGRPTDPHPGHGAQITAHPRMGGLHHRYAWKRTA